MIEDDVFKRNSGPVKRTPQGKVGMGNRGDVACSNGDDEMVVGTKQPSRRAFGEIYKVGIATGCENVPPSGFLGHTLGVYESIEPCKGSLRPRVQDRETMSIYEDLKQPLNHSEEPPPPQEPRRISETVDSAPPIEADYISRELMMALSHNEKGTSEQQQQQQQQQPDAASCLPRPWIIAKANSQSQMQPPPPPAMIISEGEEEEEDNDPPVSATTRRETEAQPQCVPAKPSTLSNIRGQRYGVRMPPPAAPMAVGIVPQDRPCRPPELHVEEDDDDNVCQLESTWKTTTQVESGALPDPSCSEYPVRPRIPLEEAHIESLPDGGVLIPKESMPKFSDSESMVKRRRQSVEFFESEIIRVKRELSAAQEEGKRLRQVALEAEAKATELLKAAESKAASPTTGPELLDGTLKLLQACKDADNAKAEASIAQKRESEARKEADETRKVADNAQCFARLARIESELVAADVKVRMDELSMAQRVLQVEHLRDITTFTAQVSSHRISTANGAAAVASLAKKAFEGAFEFELKAQELEKNSRTLQSESRVLREKLKAQEEAISKAQIEWEKEVSRTETLRKIQEEKAKGLEDSSQCLSKQAEELRSKLEMLEKDASQAQKEREEEAMKAREARREQESRAQDAEAEALRVHGEWERQVSKAQEAEKEADKFRLEAEKLNKKLAADHNKNLEIQSDLERNASKARLLTEEEADRADKLESMARKLRADAEELHAKLIQQEKETQVQQARAEGLMKERLLLLGEAEDLRLQASRMAFRIDEKPIVTESRGLNFTEAAQSGGGRASKTAGRAVVNSSQRNVGIQGARSNNNHQRVGHKAATNMVSDITETPAMSDKIQENVIHQVASDSPIIDQAAVEVKRKGLLGTSAKRRSTTTKRMTNPASSNKLDEETTSNTPNEVEMEKLLLDQCDVSQSHQEEDDSDAPINTQLPAKRKRGGNNNPNPAYSRVKRNNKPSDREKRSHEPSSLSPLNQVQTESSSTNIQQKPQNVKRKKRASEEMDSSNILSQSTTHHSERKNAVPVTTTSKRRPSRKAATKIVTYWEGEPPSPPHASLSHLSSNDHAPHDDDNGPRSKSKVENTIKETCNDSDEPRNEGHFMKKVSLKPRKKSIELDHHHNEVYPPSKGKPKDHGTIMKKKTTVSSNSNKRPSPDNRASGSSSLSNSGNEEVTSDSISTIDNKKKDPMVRDSRWDIDVGDDSPNPIVDKKTLLSNNRMLPLKSTQERSSSIHVRKLSSASSTLLDRQQPSIQTLVSGEETKEISLKTSFRGAYQKLSTTKFGSIRSTGSSLLGTFRPPKLAKRKY